MKPNLLILSLMGHAFGVVSKNITTNLKII
jgi:hypothetical protein